jgi:YLP motif-containing protein 1
MDTEDVDDANDTTSIIAETSQKAVQDPPYEGTPSPLYISFILDLGCHWS